jgi:hypothetical protein
MSSLVRFKSKIVSSALKTDLANYNAGVVVENSVVQVVTCSLVDASSKRASMAQSRMPTRSRDRGSQASIFPSTEPVMNSFEKKTFRGPFLTSPLAPRGELHP